MAPKITPLGYLLLASFFILLTYAGWIYEKSIDWDVLKRLESSPITIPNPISPVISPISTPTATLKK